MKIVVGQTYYYEDFITVDEQLFLKDWALRNEDYLIPNPTGPHRKRSPLNLLSDYPKLLIELKERLLDLEGLRDDEDIIIDDTQDMVSVQRNMGSIPEHMDKDRKKGYYLRRYNIFISLPNRGGLPIYGGDVLEIKERCILRVDAGLKPHSTIPNEGDNPRIMLSYGFHIKRK
jgi:hypothetical protein